MDVEDERISNNNNNNTIVLDEEEEQEENNKKKKHNSSNSGISSEAGVVRSRWSPKPEQILILESIFNSGMVNPPKEETARIRRLLEKFGAVGDANVFYWFQNRRSRSRRRQRQQQIHQQQQSQSQQQQQHMNMIQIQQGPQVQVEVDQTHQPQLVMMNDILASSSSIPSATNFFSFPPDVHFFQSTPGMMTVFINGVATEVPKGGPIEVKPMFGEDVVLVHSSGVALPTNDFGILLHTLHPGESYFLIPRPSVSSYNS